MSSIFSDHNAMRLDINYEGKKTVRNTNIRRLNSTFLNNQQVTEEIKREIKKFLETNDNKNRTIQNLCDAAKAVLRGKFIAIQSYLKKQEKTVRDVNTWRLNSTFLNNQQVTEKNQKGNKKFLETNNENTTTQNLCDAAKAVLRGAFIAIQS